MLKECLHNLELPICIRYAQNCIVSTLAQHDTPSYDFLTVFTAKAVWIYVWICGNFFGDIYGLCVVDCSCSILIDKGDGKWTRVCCAKEANVEKIGNFVICLRSEVCNLDVWRLVACSTAGIPHVLEIDEFLCFCCAFGQANSKLVSVTIALDVGIWRTSKVAGLASGVVWASWLKTEQTAPLTAGVSAV